MICQPATLEELRDVVKSAKHCIARGAGTKTALSALPLTGSGNEQLGEETCIVEMRNYHGIVEYEPTEFTVTVKAGTTLNDLQAALREQGQYLPFDPPYARSGATIGGTIGAGLSGPGRWRHGGLRDFVLGVQMIDGRGEAIFGGGKVVKNAAGFDLPKLVVGACGWYGLMTDITLKVFPAPEHQVTLRAYDSSFAKCLGEMIRIASEPYDLDAIELLSGLEGDQAGGELLVRFAGQPDAVLQHIKRVEASVEIETEVLDPTVARRRWDEIDSASEHDPESGGRAVVKVPLNVHLIEAFEASLGVPTQTGAGMVGRRYSMAGNMGWFSFPAGEQSETIDERLSPVASSWLAIQGVVRPVGRMVRQSEAFARMIKAALDQEGKWLSVLDEALW